AYLFPEVIVGTSSNIDDYDPAFLARYDTLLLSRFTFRDRGRAERTVREFAEAGGRAVVDMTGAPLDPLAREPRFLDVYGEPALGLRQAALNAAGVLESLRPFPESVGGVAIGEWRGTAVQGAQTELIHFDYPATKSVLIGRNVYGNGSVDFVGLNLLFHAAVTRDPLAVRILADELGLSADAPVSDSRLVLQDYAADQAGYRFRLSLDDDAWVLLPMGEVDGSTVRVDGTYVPIVGVESLIMAHVPAGDHAVEVAITRAPIYGAGWAITVAGLAILAACLLRFVRPDIRAEAHP
ncbi:MAG: hypothetical protein HY678_00430, partial [Chloroflexi bacterium]|nr:hypothetical protein [Chloroflexota bacterium]